MSEFIFQGKRVHYRLEGEGETLLMLNGIMMSTKSWAPFEAALQRGGIDPFGETQAHHQRFVDEADGIARLPRHPHVERHAGVAHRHDRGAQRVVGRSLAVEDEHGDGGRRGHWRTLAAGTPVPREAGHQTVMRRPEHGRP